MHKKIAPDIQQGTSAQVSSFWKVLLLEILVLDHLEIPDWQHEWTLLEECPSYCQRYYSLLFQGSQHYRNGPEDYKSSLLILLAAALISTQSPHPESH